MVEKSDQEFICFAVQSDGQVGTGDRVPWPIVFSRASCLDPFALMRFSSKDSPYVQKTKLNLLNDHISLIGQETYPEAFKIAQKYLGSLNEPQMSGAVLQAGLHVLGGMIVDRPSADQVMGATAFLLEHQDWAVRVDTLRIFQKGIQFSDTTARRLLTTHLEKTSPKTLARALQACPKN